MDFYRDIGRALSGYTDWLTSFVTDGFRTLLETKHLYQSVRLDMTEREKTFRPRVEGSVWARLEQGYLHDPVHLAWRIALPGKPGDLERNSEPLKSIVTFRGPDAKLYCRRCGRVEAFNYWGGREMLVGDEVDRAFRTDWKLDQVFSVALICQSCKTIPEVFLIRRVSEKLTLEGRSPMEHFVVPNSIPKKVSNFYSGAVIAHQSGQTLAGLFLLRTTCEQWARQFADPEDRADAAIDKYMDSLPTDFKARFPSLRTAYADLSVAIHAANASESLFDQTLADIHKHFAAVQLFDLKPPATNGAKEPT